MNITADEIKKLAHMSRLAIREDEIASLQQHLTSVLSYAARVQEIARDITEHEHAGDPRLRGDTSRASEAVAAIRAQAPKSQEDLFIVPKIL